MLPAVSGASGYVRTAKRRKWLRHFIDYTVYLIIVLGIVVGLPKLMVWQLGTTYPMAAITSGSMWPQLEKGDLVFIRGVQSMNEIAVGDVIVFSNANNNTLTIHRIARLEGSTIVTKGDANFNEDQPTSFDRVIGKALTYESGTLISIPFLGGITMFAQSFRN